MYLAPTIERYTDLKRQESAVYSNLDLMQQKTSVRVDQDSHVSGLLSIHVRLLRDPILSASSQVYMAKIAQYEAELAAMDELLLEKLKKTQEMHNKMMEIQRMDEIKVLLQQM